MFEGEQTTQGQAGREKVLSAGGNGARVAVFGAQDVMNLKADEAKEVFRDHDIIYVYHNRIDVVGDNPFEGTAWDRRDDCCEGCVPNSQDLTGYFQTAAFRIRAST